MMWEVGVMVGGNESTVGKLVGNVGTGAAGWYWGALGGTMGNLGTDRYCGGTVAYLGYCSY